jgi:hypothetical protein
MFFGWNDIVSEAPVNQPFRTSCDQQIKSMFPERTKTNCAVGFGRGWPESGWLSAFESC